MEIVARSAAVFFILWFLLRIMGKRELAELTAFELVLLVVMGDLVQQGVTQEDFSVTGTVLSAGTIVVLIVVTSTVSYYWNRSRPLIEGQPVVVVRDGTLLDDALHVEHISRDELREAARRAGIPDLADVSWCVLEPDGRFSFLRRHEPTPGPPSAESDERRAH
jgi:uncharacterized membrane protein YcaP (DUF421 family)